MITLDSNIFIYHFDDNPEFGFLAKELLKSIESGKISATTSELTLTEVLGFPGLTDKQAGIIKSEMTKSGVRFIKITREILLLASTLRRKYNMRTPDAIHIATAIETNAQYFVSSDHKLLRYKIPGVKLLTLTKVEEIYTRF